MEFDVRSAGGGTGTCTLEDRGLYWRLCCRCRGLSGICRLYAGARSLGVLDPAEEISLTRTVSKSGWPELPPRAGYFTLEPESGRWRGTLAGVEVEGERSGDWLLIPYDPAQPCPCEPLFCFFEIRDKCWCLNLKEIRRILP